MTHALLPTDLAARARDVAPGTSLGALADALRDELAPWLGDTVALPIPEQKARLTRVGGRCPVHGTYLEFDPRRPHEHHCTRCDVTYRGAAHDDWWAMGAQLWTAERAVHAAALYGLRGDRQHRRLAERILGELSERYLRYPNRDNVLGPTRPFFSTYLESIWLLNVCHALALLEASGPTDIGASVRARLIEPSRALIASFPEHTSNRQVWNGAALFAASVLLGDRRDAEWQLFGERRLLWMLEQLTDNDGAWYEGENYHLFAHRGFWYVVQGMLAQQLELPVRLRDRFRRGFRFPFTGVLPDECLPSRRDTAYAISIRQWRIAEYLELGYAFGRDAMLAGLLTRIYDGSVTRSSDARARSMADAERNEPPALLSRADLSWRALLCANVEPAPVTAWRPQSALRSTEGLSVIRREHARVFVGLEGGGDTRSHGHPDTLALTLQASHARWLDDPGAGSYVDRSLAWYRSTLAHHAPVVDGASQRAQVVEVLNFEDRGGAGWMRKRVTLHGDVMLTRSVVVADGYLVDRLEWVAEQDVRITLPVAAHVAREQIAGVGPWTAAHRPGAGGAEDGFDFLADVHEAPVVDGDVRVRQENMPAGECANAWYAVSTAWTMLHAAAPGVPGASTTTRTLLEARGASGEIVGVWSWRTSQAHEPVVAVSLAPGTPQLARITTADGTVAEHGPAPHGWHIALLAGGARSSIDLEGPVGTCVRLDERADTSPPAERTVPFAVPHVRGPVTSESALPSTGAVTLGRAHYVRTEEAYGAGNAPQAQLWLVATDEQFVVRLMVHTGHAVVTPGGDALHMPDNPLDNEPADVNADGVQWYVGPADGSAWWAGELLVPMHAGAGADAVRRTALVSPADPRCAEAPVVTVREMLESGWGMQLVFNRTAWPRATALNLQLTVNERPPERERRRGQLRLSGGGFARYIAGAREAPATSRFLIVLP